MRIYRATGEVGTTNRPRSGLCFEALDTGNTDGREFGGSDMLVVRHGMHTLYWNAKGFLSWKAESCLCQMQKQDRKEGRLHRGLYNGVRTQATLKTDRCAMAR